MPFRRDYAFSTDHRSGCGIRRHPGTEGRPTEGYDHCRLAAAWEPTSLRSSLKRRRPGCINSGRADVGSRFAVDAGRRANGSQSAPYCSRTDRTKSLQDGKRRAQRTSRSFTREISEWQTPTCFVEPIKRAGGVWFDGGMPEQIIDAYGGTKADREFRNVLERGGVLGGTSAGAVALGNLFTNSLQSDFNNLTTGEGFGILRGVAIQRA